MVDGGCGTWHVAGWQWVMARGAAAAHLQHSIWVTRPSNQPLQCCSAAAGACRGLITGRLRSLTQHTKCYQVFKYKNSFLLPLISLSAAFMELTCKQEHFLVASFTLLSMIRLHIIFVLFNPFWLFPFDTMSQILLSRWHGQAAAHGAGLVTPLQHCSTPACCRI